MSHQLTQQERIKGSRRSLSTRRAIVKLNKTMAQLGFTSEVIGYFKDIVVELIKATQANPLLGVVVSMVVVNILRKLNIIDQHVELILFGIIGGAAGVDILGTLFKDLGISFATGTNTDLIKPTPTVLTHAQNEANGKGGDSSDVKASLATIMALVKAIPK